MFSFVSINLKSAFAKDIKDNNFANNYNATLINELVKKDKQLVAIGHYDEAIRLANYILSLEKNNTKALEYEGVALDNLGNYTGAIQYQIKLWLLTIMILLL